MSRLAFAVKRHDQRQSDRYFRGCNRNNEKDHHLTIKLVVEPGKRHEREIGRVEHQFEGHINYEQIAPHDNAHQSHAEKQSAQEEIMVKADTHFRSFLLSKITPTIATNNNTETISNGSR